MGDGPHPMKPKHVGFDDEEEDEDDDNEHENGNEDNKNQKESDKQEMDLNEVPPAVATEEKKESEANNNAPQPHMVNGRDLNAPLCSNDDDTDDGEDLDPADKIICQFTKVVRKKNEWTVDLKHGLMHINGKDYAFQKASGGSFSWQ